MVQESSWVCRLAIPCEDDSGSVGIGYQILSLDDFIILLGECFVNPFLKIFVKILESDFSRQVDLSFLTSLSVIIIPQERQEYNMAK